MTADDVWVIFFDAKKTEGMVSMSTMQRWNAQPHKMFVTGKFRSQLKNSVRRVDAALDSKKVVVQ